MPLTAGQTLSLYEILGPLGAGAMGEVYRARDTRLDREVAIKVLPEHFSEDEERLRRFEREAKSLASLNHPNVAQIFGVDQVDDTCFLVLELVPGETLEERIARGPLPVAEALDTCRQIAEALEAAHEAGVIHRDLKPANVRITSDGKVKVLDFGLAKPTGPNAPTESTTDSVLTTEEGRLLGTPTYMAPEQARGRPIDRRVDVWAFGCVLYECLTGERAFEGATVSDVLACVLEREADLTRLPASTPAAVRELVARCLVKDPWGRQRDVGDARLVLERPGTATQIRAAVPRRLVPLALSGVLVGAVIGIVVHGTLRPETVDLPAEPRLSIHVRGEERLVASNHPNLTVSRDGRTVAWIGGEAEVVHVRPLDSYETRALTGTSGSGTPFFSPDGRWIGFVRDGVIEKVPVSGGRTVEIGRVGQNTRSFRGASWGEDGWITFSSGTSTGLSRIREDGGEAEEVVAIDPDSDVRTLRWPQVLPGDEVVLYTRDDFASQDFYDDASIVACSLTTGEERVVVEGASQARYAAGHVVFARGGNLHRVRFDPARLETEGEPRKLLAGVETDGSTGAAMFALTDDGGLVWTPGVPREQHLRVAWRDRDSSELLDLPAGAYRYLRLSPDEERFSYVLAQPDASHVWVFDFKRGTAGRQSTRGDAAGAIWSPDGTQILYGADRREERGIQSLRVDSGAAPRLLVDTEGLYTIPSDQPDDERMFAQILRPETGWDVVLVDLVTGELSDLAASSDEEWGVYPHPTSSWFAYTSNRSGLTEVYLACLEPGTVAPQASEGGGADPRWSPDGRTLYYIKPGAFELWAVDVELDAHPILGPPRLVLTDFFHELGLSSGYDVAEDGRILCLVDTAGIEAGREIRVHSEWIEGEEDPVAGR